MYFKLKIAALCCLVAVCAQRVFCQTDHGGVESILASDELVIGVGEQFDGINFSYSYPIPSLSNSLIIRATDGKQKLMWHTPQLEGGLSEGKDAVNYLAPVAIGTGAPFFTMDVAIDGESAFVIDNRNEDRWSMSDEKGRELSFESIFMDGSHDRFGFLYLRIPKSLVKEDGAPFEIEITADKRGMQSWFMVFTDPMNNGLSAELTAAISGGKQQLIIDVIHLGAPEVVDIKLDGKSVVRKEVKMGGNTFMVAIDPVKKERRATLEVVKSKEHLKRKITLRPTLTREVYFTQHTHTDIGYTRPQNEILAEHIRYIDYALDYCDATDGLPTDAQFRWTCESTWAVEQFLASRPQEQIARLMKRVAEGRIEITGMLFNFSELPDERTLAASLQPIGECHDRGIDVKVAMQNDVNGVAWIFADYLPTLGVKYLNMGSNTHRALSCFDYPTVFRWQSPSGSEMIAYRAEHYMSGNFAGVTDEKFEEFEFKFLRYLNKLEKSGYPYDCASLQLSGSFTDNAPPSMTACRNVELWNEKYSSPHIRLSVASEFFERVEDKYYDELPVHRESWPDWWTDGFGATARETAVGRYAKTNLMASETLLSFAALQGVEPPLMVYPQIDEVNSALLFNDEHTAGFSESVRQPWCRASMDQRALKESYAWEAYRKGRILGETAAGLLQSGVERCDRPTIMVYNTLNFDRTVVAELYIDHAILPLNREFKIVDMATGEAVKCQPLESRADGTYWQLRVNEVPAMGSRQLRVDVSDVVKAKSEMELSMDGDVVENDFYRVTFDFEKGAIGSLWDKDLKSELIESAEGYDLGEFVYERLEERSSMEAYKMGDYTRERLSDVWFVGVDRGEIYDSYRFAGNSRAGVEMANSHNFSLEVKLHHADKLIELRYSLIKRSVTDPEAVYVALPFALDGAKSYCELPGGEFEVGVEQIKGSSNDWNTHQNYAAVRSDRGQIVVGSNEIPLMQFGAINTGRYEAGAQPESCNIFSWVLNNYWTTNFNAEQRGELVWEYFITSTEDSSRGEASRFGWSNRVDVPTRVMPALPDAPREVQTPVKQYLKLSGGEFMMVGCSPIEGEKALLLQLREVGGRESEIVIDGYSAHECNLLGERVEGGSLTIAPLATKFVKLKLN